MDQSEEAAFERVHQLIQQLNQERSQTNIVVFDLFAAVRRLPEPSANNIEQVEQALLQLGKAIGIEHDLAVATLERVLKEFTRYEMFLMIKELEK